MGDNLFIGIAVRKPEGQAILPEGIHTSLDKMCQWADSEDYEVWRWSDAAGGTVTTEKIESDILNNSIDGISISGRLHNRDRIIVYFCGHGLFSGGAQIWLLSGGLGQDTSLLGVTRLIAKLRVWEPTQIGIISDACAQHMRGLEDNTEAPIPPPTNPQYDHDPQVDRFFAAADGGATYASEDGGKFTSVISRALVQDPPERLSVSPNGPQVDSDSLATFIDRTFNYSGAVGETKAITEPTFRAPNHVYRHLPEQPAAELPNHAEIVAGQEHASGQRERQAKDQYSAIIKATSSNSKTILWAKTLGVGVWTESNLPGSPEVKLAMPGESLEIPDAPNLGGTIDPKRFIVDPADEHNGMLVLGDAQSVSIVPEFADWSTWVKPDLFVPVADTVAVPSLNVRPIGRPIAGFTKRSTENQLPLHADSVLLLSDFSTKYRGREFSKLLIEDRASWSADPLMMTATAYYAHRSGLIPAFKDSLREYLSEGFLGLKQAKTLTLDVAVLCDLPVEYSGTVNALIAKFEGNEYKLSNQIPMLGYGTSLARDARVPAFLCDYLVSIRGAYSGGLLPNIQGQERVERTRDFFSTYFKSNSMIMLNKGT